MSHAREVEYVSPDLFSGGIHGNRAAIGDMLKSAGNSSGGPKRQSGQTSLLSYAKPTGRPLATPASRPGSASGSGGPPRPLIKSKSSTDPLPASHTPFLKKANPADSSTASSKPMYPLFPSKQQPSHQVEGVLSRRLPPTYIPNHSFPSKRRAPDTDDASTADGAPDSRFKQAKFSSGEDGASDDINVYQRFINSRGAVSTRTGVAMSTGSGVGVSTVKPVTGGRESLSDEQKEVAKIVLEEHSSLFFTGRAGTGKSYLLRYLIKELRSRFGRDRVAVTAATGMAAVNIDGGTVHSFAGFGLGLEPVDVLVKKIGYNKNAFKRWQTTKVLVIDEGVFCRGWIATDVEGARCSPTFCMAHSYGCDLVSMVDAELFDKLEEVARKVRKSSLPFGGIQLVMTGDFFQLPPVPDKQRETKFLFESKRFSACVPTSYNLTTAFRQSDPTFLTVLDELRMGQLSASSVAVLRGLERTPPGWAGKEPSVIYSRREEVDRENERRMREIRADEREFAATDSGDQANLKKLQSSCIAPSTLKLKQDALVMLIKNKNQTLVNGALGKVVGFSEDSRLPIVRFDRYALDLELEQEEWTLEQNGQVVARRRQIPLVLAWATSVHKAQGQTLDRLKVDLRSVL
ncbi:hypothetical protein M427DRAFT_320796 [Gonapodya prolifera JEL478]|uniref:ATP-dependent DNA helicase n=1 Tax=Gonapodya prolifera (strain JEL478) TaxID=1344416 RepID=A0A139AG23_GONPJ|nr:hypothetical protein M427DRAFT_320796 [Gonapodya prolifera JEL478]|eukprot:KXS15708.1 hypothetical protein M427DRAFT_320796 [Gonapodya prolifera JEL478]